MKRATNEEWQAIGDQAKKCRDELFILMNMSSGKMPVAITRILRQSIMYLNRFRSTAENRMLKTSDNQSLNTFYGEK